MFTRVKHVEYEWEDIAILADDNIIQLYPEYYYLNTFFFFKKYNLC